MIARLRADTRGIATIEFGIWASIFFMVILGALDFGIWRTYQLRLSSAVEQGSILAFEGRGTLDNAAATTIRSYVEGAARLPVTGGDRVTTTLGCNGGTDNCVATNRPCACLATAANGSSAFTPATCGTACSGGTDAGYYLTIRARYPYHAMIRANTVLDGQTLTDSVTMRLQ